jgi:hypothetical protein
VVVEAVEAMAALLGEAGEDLEGERVARVDDIVMGSTSGMALRDCCAD